MSLSSPFAASVFALVVLAVHPALAQDAGPTDAGPVDAPPVDAAVPEATEEEDAPEPELAPLVPPMLPSSQHGHPPYPASGDGLPARVLLRIDVGTDGRVTDVSRVEVDRSGAEAEIFYENANDYVRGLHFEPASRDGQPVAVRIQFEVLFQAQGPAPHEHERDPHHHHGASHEHEQGNEEPVGEHVAADLTAHDVAAAGHHHHSGGDEEPEPEPTAYGATGEVARPFQATSSADLRGEDLRLRPFGSTGDLLNAASGFYVIQHAGGGKANQYFLRGFDSDHGTDVALFVDGIPINHVSHGHGQGYTDLQWVIPELVERLEIRKGPYFAEYGDFATAGAADLRLGAPSTGSSFSLGGGTYGSFRSVAVIQPTVRVIQPLIAAEVYGTNGPFENGEGLRRLNLFARITRRIPSGGRLSLTGTSHLSRWNASGQIPLRAVRDGRLDRFGSVDPTEGGNVQRHGVYANLSIPSGDPSEPSGQFDATAWLTMYRFALYSNFTFFSANEVDGDMIRQGDARLTGGFRAQYAFKRELGPVTFRTRAGVQLRIDDIETRLDDAPQREIGLARIDAAIAQSSFAVFAEEDIRYRWFRGVLGARADYFGFSVDDRLEDRTTLGDRSSGEEDAFAVSPKVSLIVTPIERLQLFANFGLGFHSNDARGIVRGTDPVTPLTQAMGYEAGARLVLPTKLTISGAFFALDLDSETVWVGDEGTTEARGATRRLGVEAEARWQFLEWLRVELDFTWTNSTFVNNPGNANAVALAPTFLMDGAVVLRHRGTGLSARVGGLYIADRPATEDRFLEAEGFFRLDASVQWKQPRFSLSLNVLNLANTDWRQAQFATTSRLQGETGPASCPDATRAVGAGAEFEGCEDVNFTPGWPIHVMATATVNF